jgi:hypothetical protein
MNTTDLSIFIVVYRNAEQRLVYRMLTETMMSPEFTDVATISSSADLVDDLDARLKNTTTHLVAKLVLVAPKTGRALEFLLGSIRTPTGEPQETCIALDNISKNPIMLSEFYMALEKHQGVVDDKTRDAKVPATLLGMVMGKLQS